MPYCAKPSVTAKYVGFKCVDDYFTNIDMPTALHPQAQLVWRQLKTAMACAVISK